MDSSAAMRLSDEHVVLFFRKLKDELQCSSTLKLVSQVRSILSKIKGTYSASEMKAIVESTPPLMHFLIMDNSRRDEENKSIHHLDELVDALCNEDQQTGRGLFTGEIQALGTVITILKRLQFLLARAGVQAFPYMLSTELQQAVIEEAA